MDQAWYRVERRDAHGTVVDWVEVGRCASCGRGVDREFPCEYVDVGGTLYCRHCLERQPGGVNAGAVVHLLQQSGRKESGHGQADRT